jgi:holo-[acyl-carrier protein] synthase
LQRENELIEDKQIGIDIVDIGRFRKKNFVKNESFYKKIFTDLEIRYCRGFSDPYPHFAGKFALKEAVQKSIQENMIFKKIETFHINSRPAIKIEDQEKKYAIIASISHEKRYAIAIAISKKN